MDKLYTDQDDIVDLEHFDVIAWLKNEMRPGAFAPDELSKVILECSTARTENTSYNEPPRYERCALWTPKQSP